MQNFTNLKSCLFGFAFLLVSLSSFGQQVTISGAVTDEENADALPGATILERGTTNGTITDLNGNYSITISDPSAVLVFSFIGYTAQSITVDSQSKIDVALAVDIEKLEEVVVVGYGTQKKSDLTGAVGIVDAEEMTKQASSDLTQQMQGRIAGVQVSSDGQPGATPSVRIRGVGTFGSGGASAEPLYVVDGFPLQGGIRDINPNDIESIQVLKDATAGAIYGNRAANGVVIITTKGGSKNQKFAVGFNAYYGVQKITQKIPVLDREGYQTVLNEMLTNANAALVSGNDPSSPDYINDIDTDWQDEGFKDGLIANYNLNFTGGTDKTNYFMSLDYLENEGTLVGAGPNYERISFRVNTESQFGKLKVGQSLYMVRSDENPLFYTTQISLPGGRPSLVNDLIIAAPTIPLLDENREGGYGGADAIIHNSISLNVPGFNSLVDNSTLVNRVLAGVYAEYQITEGLAFRTNIQYDNTDITDELFVPQYDLGYFFPGPTAQYQVTDRSSNSSLIENTLKYNKTFGNHQLNLLAGQSYQNFNFRQVTAIGSGLNKPYVLSLGSAESFSVTDNIQESTLFSFFGRVNYTFDDRYLVTVNVRRDASSKFIEANRVDVFPSVSLGWKIHNDINLPDFITDLKLRGGIGQLGNQEIDNYAYQPTINRAIPYQYGNERVLGGSNTLVIDPTIRWETRTTRTVALDGVLFDGKLEFTAEYFSNTSEDVLLRLPIPFSAGSTDPSVITNTASIENSGIELSATFRQNLGDFSFEISPNFYSLNNEVTKINENLENIAGIGTQNIVGRSIGEHYGWVYDGIFQADGEVNVVGPDDPGYNTGLHAFQEPGTRAGDVRFKDLDGDGAITEEDRTYLGKGMPTFYYGINFIAKYKNFDFTFFGSGSGGNLINSNIYKAGMATTGFTNWHEDIEGRWTEENPSNEIPRVVWLDPNQNNRDSDRPGWLQNGNYFRINTLSLGYNLPSSLLDKAKISSVRIYFTMQNVHTFTAYKGFNPDFRPGAPAGGGLPGNGVLEPGYDYGTFPRPRTTMLGVQIKF